ncbi:PepSY domain-containing protein [Litorimonas sp. WD9-15]|uniref:PepSY domain-containing protein n=1 Tax=Litorimonas sp. WD9-15 TaxID=3418716 RepID=UPI003D06F977
MLTKRHILSAALAAVLSLGAAAPGFAQSYSMDIVLEAQRSVSPAEAKSIARSRVKGGEVVDISRRGDTYRVRVIAKNGKVVDVYIDANTGRVKK